MPTPKKDPSLSQQEMLFVLHYSGNAQEASRAAGYKDCKKAAFRLMRRQRVLDAIRRKQNKAIDTAGKIIGREGAISVQSVLRELARLGFADPRKFFNPDNTAKDPTELDDDTAMSLAGFEVIEQRDKDGNLTGYLKKFKIADKGRNLERIGRHLGMFIERHLNLPGDFAGRSVEEQEFFCQHGFYPDGLQQG